MRAATFSLEIMVSAQPGAQSRVQRRVASVWQANGSSTLTSRTSRPHQGLTPTQPSQRLGPRGNPPQPPAPRALSLVARRSPGELLDRIGEKSH
jgi:hypothetical protein